MSILYFTADWCQPCKKTKPIVEELNKDNNDIFKIIDVDKDRDWALDFSIQSVPTFIVLKNDKEVRRFVGAQTKESLESMIGLLNG